MGKSDDKISADCIIIKVIKYKITVYRSCKALREGSIDFCSPRVIIVRSDWQQQLGFSD